MHNSLQLITVDELYAATAGVWAQMLQLPLLPGPPVQDEVPGSQHYGVRIELDEDRHYALYAVCDKPMMDAAAQRMFALPPAELDDNQRQDALGELLNIVAAEISQGNEHEVHQGLPLFSAPHGSGMRQQLICAIEAHSGRDHIYLALCCYLDTARDAGGV